MMSEAQNSAIAVVQVRPIYHWLRVVRSACTFPPLTAHHGSHCKWSSCIDWVTQSGLLVFKNYQCYPHALKLLSARVPKVCSSPRVSILRTLVELFDIEHIILNETRTKQSRDSNGSHKMHQDLLLSLENL